MKERTICHLNIVGFKSAVASAKDRSLRGKPYIIAGSTGGRSLALDCSPEAVKQGVMPGMPLAVAERRIKDLLVLPPDPMAYETMNSEVERVITRYAPLWENDKAGNLYLDISGTTGLFGPPCDCSQKLLHDILEQAGLRPATAIASNKLVSKVATRTIRPVGLIQVQNDTEAEFLCHQDIRLLPGMGVKLLRTASIAGMKEIGEIAALTVSEATALFGKQGLILRSMAQGIDSSRIEERSEERAITQQADFNEDVIDDEIIAGAIETLAQQGGFEMRRDKLGATIIKMVVCYSDGMKAEGQEKLKRLCVLDKDIAETARKLFDKITVRRIRLRSIGLALEGLTHLSYEPDLFEPETEAKNRSLQEAIDKIQTRYGVGKISRAIMAAGSSKHTGKLLTADTACANKPGLLSGGSFL